MASRPKRSTRSTVSYIEVVSDDDNDPSDNGDYEHDLDNEYADSDVSYYGEDEGPARKRLKPDDDVDFHYEDQTDDEHGAISDEDAAESDLEIEENIDVAEDEQSPASKPNNPKSRAKKVKFSLDADHNPRSFAREPQPYKFSYENPLDFNSKPLFTIAQFFEDLSEKLKMKYGTDLIKFCKLFREKPLNVVTFCSGTESPILAIGLVQKTIETKYGSDYKFVTRHQASAEIHPAKAAYIETNFTCDVIFRDIVEIQLLWKNEAKKPHSLTTMYGGKAMVPEDTDILIAGFACDDFSSLNNSRKALDDKGESGDTFYAIIAYADMYKPKMIILENVMHAPWTDEKAKKWKDKPHQTSIQKHLDNVGYFSVFLKMDTKNHYLPHTRNRGYMVAIHRASFPGADWTALEEKCKNMIEGLEHAATVPVEAMLFPSDDPRLEVLDQERKSDNKIVKWEKCKTGHHDYCVDHGLGEKHPITGWKGDGSKEMPDFHRPMPGMTERVADSIDIAHKRNLVRGFDDRHYNRNTEWSQNVFRVEDSSRNGLQQCLTPTNIAFSTYQGRRLTGAEAATLQGIDLNLVDTTRLSEQLLTDMCGNAMSSTVVGTVIFAALLTFQDTFNLENRDVAQVEPEPQPASNLEEAVVEVVSKSSSYFPASVEDILTSARETVRLCFCEGRHKTDVKTTFLRCRVCGHTACSKCGKNPPHDYEEFESQFTENRKLPTVFEALIKRSIPTEIDLSSLWSEEAKSFLAELSKAIPQDFDFNQKAWNCVLDAIEKALLSSVFLRSIRRTECWTVEYDSPLAIIKLVVSGGCVEWRLFANAKELPLASAAGKYLRQFPIARMVPVGADIVQGPWGFWVPAKKTFEATIISRGPLIPTYTNAAGLTDVLQRYNHQFLDIEFKPGFDARYFSEPLEGRYIASPMCGQAFNTMHIQQGREPGKKPLGLFFDHELQTGNPAHHKFKFSTEFRRLDWGEYVEAIAELPASWRQPVIFAVETDDSTIRVQGTDTLVQNYKGEIVDKVKIITHGRFVAIDNSSLKLSGSMFRYHKLPVNISRVDFTCGKDLAIFTCQGKISHAISCFLPRNRTISIDRKIGASFWREFLWFLEKDLQIHGHTEANADWHPSTGITKECPSCAPKAPFLLWALKKGKYIPYEDPEQASAWEKGMKSRPAPMKVLFRIDGSGNIAFQVSMNVATLMHCAKARLVVGGDCSDIKMDFRLITNYNRDVKPVYEPLTIKNNNGAELAEQPFKRYTLRDEQRRVVTWMCETERSGMSFIEEEVVESTVNEIGYRAEGRATREVLRRGGILAQDVGFGKTVVMLALINQTLRIAKKTIKTSDENAGGIQPGAIPTDATLILLPSHLVDQWHSEISKFLPEFKDNVIVMGSGKALHFAKLTIREVIEAKIIIVAWDNCTKPPYLKMLANLAGLVEPAVNGTSERAYDAWYEVAVSNIENNIDHLRTKGPTGFVDHLETQWLSSVAEASSVKIRVPSRHITGAAYVNSDKRSAAKTDGNANKKRKRGAAQEKAEEFSHSISFTDGHWESMNNAILEMFRFKRIIIDELTYRKGWVNSNLKNLKALHRWLLTGTPAKGNHADIKSLADLLQVNLGVDDFSGLRNDIFNKKTSDLTKSELFLMAQEAPSTPWLERRHKHAQLFLDTFCRKDAAQVDHIILHKHICLVDLSPSERAIYLELLQFLAATEFILKRGKSAKGDRSDQIQQVVPSSGDGKPALFLRASQFTFPGVRDTSELCDMIVVRRKNELQAYSDQFKKNLKQTIWLHKQEPECPRFAKFVARVESHTLGDIEVSKQVVQYISKAKARYHKDDWEQFYRKKGTDITKCKSTLPEYPTNEKATGGHSHLTRVASEIRTLISWLNNDVEEIINQTRALRFFQNILLIQRGAELVCARCGIAGLTPAKVMVMGQCGHLLGLECCKDNACPVSGCAAYNREYQKLHGATLVGSGSQWCSEHGSKIDQIIKLVRSIVNEKKEKVLIFAQWSESTDKLEEALVAEKVPFSDLRKEATSSKTLQHFQNGTPPKKGAKVSQVLIMNIGDANASGSNLTMANHVIFMQPYYTSGENAQENYESAMTQAIGRARRWGQAKEVHVYHFLTVNTIDIDYHEARTDTELTRDATDPSRGVVKELNGSTNWVTHLGTYFAKTMKFDGAKRKGY